MRGFAFYLKTYKPKTFVAESPYVSRAVKASRKEVGHDMVFVTLLIKIVRKCFVVTKTLILFADI